MNEVRKCKITGQSFEVTNKEIQLLNQMNLPLPNLCRSERMRRLMATRNEWRLYRRRCDASGDEILSAYHPSAPFKVYKNEVWWGSDWDALGYGRGYDFNRPFFEQFAELQKEVPREGTSVFSSENCVYNSHIRESKNSYLNSLVYRCEDLYYSYWMVNDKDVFDSLYTNDTTLSYWCNEVNNSYRCIVLRESNNCNECYFSYQLRGCDHCLFCTNLTNKSYHLFNKPCTKEEFEVAKNKTLNGSWTRWQEAMQHYDDLLLRSVHRGLHNLNSENCQGDHLYNCRNCNACHEGFDSEDCVNCISLSGSKDVHNTYSAGWTGCEVATDCCVIRGSKDVAFCTYVWFSSNMRYCDSCNASDSCFGCIGLQHKKYCILNKQYTKEEYEKLLPRIIEHMKSTGEWGEFFPAELSPFAYNESAAQDFFPLEKTKVIERGWRWREKDQKEYRPASIKQIPDQVADVEKSFTKEILSCETCQKNYKIIPQELDFYQKNSLAIPRHCSDCRHKKRFNQRNGYQLFERTCDQCQKVIQSTYKPDRSEKVYCDNCYLNQLS